jgi:hypothetical protein
MYVFEPTMEADEPNLQNCRRDTLDPALKKPRMLVLLPMKQPRRRLRDDPNVMKSRMLTALGQLTRGYLPGPPNKLTPEPILLADLNEMEEPTCT